MRLPPTHRIQRLYLRNVNCGLKMRPPRGIKGHCPQKPNTLPTLRNLSERRRPVIPSPPEDPAEKAVLRVATDLGRIVVVFVVEGDVDFGVAYELTLDLHVSAQETMG